MNYEKLIIATILCFCLFTTISFSCATDNINGTVEDGSNINFEPNNTGTFDELNSDIQNLHPGDVYNLNNDYSFSGKNTDTSFDHVINIDKDNVTINGNGHAKMQEAHHNTFQYLM